MRPSSLSDAINCRSSRSRDIPQRSYAYRRNLQRMGQTGAESSAAFGAGSRQLREPAERVREPHVLDRLAIDLKEARRAHEVREALRPRDRDVQPVPREQEVEPVGDV